MKLNRADFPCNRFGIAPIDYQSNGQGGCRSSGWRSFFCFLFSAGHEVSGLKFRWVFSLATLYLLLCSPMVNASGPLAVSLTVNPNPAAPGEQVLVSITVSNPTGSTVFGGIVQMSYPVGMNSLSESSIVGPLDALASCGGGTGGANCEAGELVQWNLGTLAPGQVVETWFPATVATNTDGTLIPWEVTVSNTGGGLASDSVSLIVDSSPELTVRVQEESDPTAAGDILTYTINYANRSAGSVLATALNFTLPASATFVSATGGGAESGGVVSWGLATIPAGEANWQAVSVLVNGGVASGTLLESLAVIDGMVSNAPTQRKATATTHVAPGGPLAVSLTVNPNPAAPGEQVLVSITVSNPTGSTVFGGIVQMSYPVGMNSLSESSIVGPLDALASCGGGTGGASCKAGELVQWNLGTLAPGQVVEAWFPATVATNTDGTLIPWEVTVSEDSASRVKDSAVLAVDSSPKLTLSIQEESDPSDGFNLLYTINYANHSAGNVSSTVLNFVLPAQATSAGSITGAGTESDGVVSWSLGTLTAGEVGQQSVWVSTSTGGFPMVMPLAAGTLLESLAVIDGMVSNAPTQRKATATTHVAPGGPLAVSLTVNPNPAAPGEQVLVSITVSNPTGFNVFGGVLQMSYPVGMNTLSESSIVGPLDALASCGGGTGGASCKAGELVQWNLGTLAPGQVVETWFPATVATNTDGTLIPWEVTVSEDSASRVKGSAVLAVDSSPKLTLSIQKDSDPVAADGLLTYTINYANRSAGDVLSTALDFTLPGGVTFESATGGGTESGGVVSWSLGTLPAGRAERQAVTIYRGMFMPPPVGRLYESLAVIDGLVSNAPTQRKATATTHVAPGGPLAVSLTVNPNPAAPGEQVLVSITISNPTGSNVFGGILQMSYPVGMNTLSESSIVGPLDALASCGGGTGGASCKAGELVQWNLGTLAPGQVVETWFPATVATNSDGTLIPWEVTVSEDSASRVKDSAVLLIGALDFAGDIDQKDDLAGDGKGDIVLRNSNNGELMLFEMDGNQITSSNIGGLNQVWTVKAIADFGGDSRADLLLRHSNNGQLFLYEMDGNLIIPSNIGGLNQTWKIAGTGDLGGDGKADIVLRNINNGQLYLYEMDGNQKTGSNIGGLSLGWDVVGVDDFGGDGKADILLRNTASGQLYLYEMDGNQKTGSNIGGLSLGWDVVGIGDLDGDGKADIVLRNINNGQLYLYEMDGNSRTGSNIGGLPLAWDVVRIADYGGDGKADLLLRNINNGQLFLYEMDSNQVTPSNIGGLNPVWEVQVQ